MTPTKDSPLSEAELCRANGWAVGTHLVGDEGYGPTVIRITALGEAKMLARRVSHNGRPVQADEASFVLWCRDWREVPSTVPDHLPDNDESRGHGSVR